MPKHRKRLSSFIKSAKKIVTWNPHQEVEKWHEEEMKRNNHYDHLGSYTCFIAWNIFSAEIEYRETKWGYNTHERNIIHILWKSVRMIAG